MNQQLTVTDQPAPDQDWQDALAAACPGPHAGPAWMRYRRARGAVPHHLLLRDAEGTVAAVGLAWAFRSRWRFWQGTRWVLDRIPWLVPDVEGSCAVDGDQVTAALVDHVRSRSVRALELNSFDAPETRRSLTDFGLQESLRHEFLLSLTDDDAARLADMKSSHRRKLRQAERAQVTVTEESLPVTARLLHELQGHTQSRRQERGETMDTLSREQAEVLGREFVGGGGGRMFVASREGRPLSCLLMGVQGARAYYLMGGTNQEGLGLNAATLLMWEAQQHLRQDGVELLNLGGVPAHAEQESAAEHGLYRFKAGFGARRILCRSGTLG